MTETSLTFEQGYERLQSIAGRINQEEVPVSEMCELFAEGKGLEQALTQYLDEQRSRVEAIQNGEGVRRFTIAGQTGQSQSPEPVSTDGRPNVSDFVPVSNVGQGVSDDDIPF